MSTTITATNGAGATSPSLILGYEADREGRNIVHDLIGGGIAVALIAPRPRSGDLQLFYPVEADAWASVALHAEESSFSVTDTDRPAVGMTYVVTDGVKIALDSQTRNRWVVTVSFQEVEP